MHLPMRTIRGVHEDFDLRLWVFFGKKVADFFFVFAEHYPNLFTLKIHHGGLFTKQPGRQYIQGKMNFVDLVDGDELSVHEIDAMVKELGYSGNYPMYYHFLTSGSNLDIGLRALGNDQEVLDLIKYTSINKLIEVYIEQIITTVFTYNKSPGGPNVVIEELPDENPVIPQSTRKSKKKGSTSCKKRLFWSGTEKRNVDQRLKLSWDNNLGLMSHLLIKRLKLSWDNNLGLMTHFLRKSLIHSGV